MKVKQKPEYAFLFNLEELDILFAIMDREVTWYEENGNIIPDPQYEYHWVKTLRDTIMKILAKYQCQENSDD